MQCLLRINHKLNKNLRDPYSKELIYEETTNRWLLEDTITLDKD